MKEKAIRRMNREELLELLIQYTDEKEALEFRVKELESQLCEANRKLEERTLAIANAGSIAQASLQLSGIFEAAQRAADLYLENVQRMETAYKKEDAAQAANDEMQQASMRRRKRGMGL